MLTNVFRLNHSQKFIRFIMGLLSLFLVCQSRAIYANDLNTEYNNAFFNFESGPITNDDHSVNNNFLPIQLAATQEYKVDNTNPEFSGQEDSLAEKDQRGEIDNLSSKSMLTKTVDKDYYNPGGSVSERTLTYTIVPNFPGNQPLSVVILSDPIPTGTTYINNSLAPGSDAENYMNDVDDPPVRVEWELGSTQVGVPGNYIAPGGMFTATLYPTQDAYVRQQSPDTNFGTTATLLLKGIKDQGERAFLQFNLTSIPANSVIVSANLTVQKNGGDNTNLAISAHRVNTPWSETLITWNNQSTYNAGHESSINVNANGAYSWPLTSLVQEWYTGSTSNNGVILRFAKENDKKAKEKNFQSREGTPDTSDPKLVVNYTIPTSKFTVVSLDSSPSLIGGQGPHTVVVTMTVQVGQNTASGTLTPPASLTVINTSGATVVLASAPTPANATIPSGGGSVIFMYTYAVSNSNAIGQIVFSGKPTSNGTGFSGNGFPSSAEFVDGMSDSVIVSPALIFQARISESNPPGIVNNTATLKDALAIPPIDASTQTRALWNLTTGINDPTRGSVTAGGQYPHGQIAEIIATENPGYYFSGWSGSATGRNNPLHLLMDTNKSVTANFEQKTSLTLVGLTAQNKVYDGSDAASIVDYGTLSPVAPGDDVSLVTTSASAKFSNKHVGTGKTVTVIGLALTGADAYKYSLGNQTTSATITARTLTLSNFTANNKTYDGNTNVTGTGFSDNRLPGDILIFSYVAAYNDKHAGAAKPVNYSGITIAGGADQNNYTLASNTGTASATIMPRTLTLSGFTANNKVYDGNTTVPGTGFSDNRVPGDILIFFYNAAFNNMNVGIGKPVYYTDIAITGGADQNNYVLSNTTGLATANITPKALTLPNLLAENKVYDRSTSAVINSYGQLYGIYVPDAVTLNTTLAVANFASRHAGSHYITVTGLQLEGENSSNYSIGTQTTSAPATIMPKPLGLTGLLVENKAYDGTTTATIASFGFLQGVEWGDAIFVDPASPYTANFDTPDSGTDKTVTVTGLILAGADKNNYVFTGPWYTTASIIANAYTISANAGPGGKIEPSGNVVVLEGEDQPFVITANENRKIDTLLVDSLPVPAAVGQTTYTYSFTNVFSNHSISVTFKEIVVITVTGGNVTLECNQDSYVELGATAVDGLGNPLPVYIDNSQVNTSVTGSYIVFYGATDGVNTAAATRTVTVQDTIVPALYAEDVTLECGIDTFVEDVYAWDTCEGVLTDAIVIGGDTVQTNVPQSYEVSYSVSDQANNTSNLVSVVDVNDTIAPIITLLGDNPVVTTDGRNYSVVGSYLASDICEGDLTHRVMIGGDDWNTNAMGIYTIYYSVSDSHNNTAEAFRDIIVRHAGCEMDFALVVEPNPVIVGEQVRFEATELSGSCSFGILTYAWEWQPATGNKSEFIPIPEAPNSSIYLIEEVGFEHAGMYRCTITDETSIPFITEPVSLIVTMGVPTTRVFGCILIILIVAAAGIVMMYGQWATLYREQMTSSGKTL